MNDHGLNKLWIQLERKFSIDVNSSCCISRSVWTTDRVKSKIKDLPEPDDRPGTMLMISIAQA